MSVEAVSDKYPVISMKPYTKVRLMITLGQSTISGAQRSASAARLFAGTLRLSRKVTSFLVGEKWRAIAAPLLPPAPGAVSYPAALIAAASAAAPSFGDWSEYMNLVTTSRIAPSRASDVP